LPLFPLFPLTELDTFSTPIPKVETSFFTKFSVCGVMVASLTETL
jgi:hypothetical protein